MNSLLSSLPIPPHRESGWPWTEVPTMLMEEATSERVPPRISIVIPSFNQGRYIEEAIRSVLLQGYPNLELTIMDGGSTDHSVEIIQKYETWLTGWVSEPDGGQSDAINKGFDRSTGEIIHWLCSDDLLMPGALWNVAKAFAKEPECDVVVGHCLCTYEDSPEKNGVLRSSVESIQTMPYLFGVWQPSCFFRRAAVKREQVLRRELHYCMDRELWCRLQACGARWKAIDKTLSSNRFTGDNKSLVGQSKIIQEIHEIYRSYESERVPLTALLLWFWLPLVTVGLKRPPGAARNLLRTASSSVTFGLKRIYPAVRVRALQKEFYRYSM